MVISNGVPAGASTNGVAVRNAKLLINNVLFNHTSTVAAAASAQLWMICARVVDTGTEGNCTKFQPAGNATHKPNAGPLLLFAGFKKPDATTVNAAPFKFNVCNGAENSATTSVPALLRI